jgi:hypothetical protein
LVGVIRAQNFEYKTEIFGGYNPIYIDGDVQMKDDEEEEKEKNEKIK